MSSFMVIIFSLFLSQNLLANPQEGIPGDELSKRIRTGFVTQHSAIIDALEYAYI